MRNWFVIPLSFLPCALALTGCGSGGGNFPNPPLLTSAPVGTYGAHDINLQVTAAGAQVTLQCGQSAQIMQPLTLDASGRFDVAGTLTRFQAYPVPPPKPVPARFTGTTDGKTMTLTITPAPGRYLPPFTNTYTLTYGTSPTLDFGGCPG